MCAGDEVIGDGGQRPADAFNVGFDPIIKLLADLTSGGTAAWIEFDHDGNVANLSTSPDASTPRLDTLSWSSSEVTGYI